MIKWITHKLICYSVILVFLVAWHYSTLAWNDSSAGLVRELTSTEARRENLVSRIQNVALKQLIEKTESKRRSYEIWYSFRELRLQCQDELENLSFWQFQKKGVLAEEVRALNLAESAAFIAYQSAAKANDEAFESSFDDRKKLASPESLAALTTEEEKLSREYAYFLRVKKYYEDSASKGYRMHDAQRKWDQSVWRYKKQKLHVQHLQAKLGNEEVELINQQLSAFNASISELKKKISTNPVANLAQVTRSQTAKAGLILAGAIATPVVIKLFLYYLVAPILGRSPAIVLVAEHSHTSIEMPAQSDVSLAVEIQSNEEILIKPSFIQSKNEEDNSSTQWLFNSSIPFTSIIAKLCFLTKIKSANKQSIRVVISSQKDPIAEVGIIKLPADSAMVLHPRSIIGVIKARDQKIVITRHWRLFSLHAWLTLQLRYLVFHGPCQLIVKGGRGVKLERPLATNPRMINQLATIGFNAHLAYRSKRCETFIPYLRGQEDLFQDVFSGSNGAFVYEEVPIQSLKAGVTGRGIEGVLDTALKIFGI